MPFWAPENAEKYERFFMVSENKAKSAKLKLSLGLALAEFGNMKYSAVRNYILGDRGHHPCPLANPVM